MRKIKLRLLALCLILTFLFSSTAYASGKYDINKLKAANKYSSLIIVSGYNKSYAIVSMYNKSGDKWKRVFSTRGRVGKNGIGRARENKKTTPRGIWSLYTPFGIKKNPGCKLKYTKVNNNHYWSAKTNKLHNGYTKGEHLISCGKAYNYGIGIGWNRKAKKGYGYAYFLQCFGKKGRRAETAGCVAIPEKYMKKCLQNIHKDTHIIIDYSDKIKNY